MKRFKDFQELTTDLAFDLRERLASDERLVVEFGASNQSCSAYLNISLFEDDELLDDFKVRFSDHPDRHGSDITIRIDHLITAIENDGEYVATEIAADDYEAALANAMAAVNRFIEKNT